MTTHTTDSNGEVEMQIRNALQQEASAYDVPTDLAARTLEAADVRTTLSWRERLAAWFDARKMPRSEGSPSRHTPQWAYAAVLPVVVGLFVVGSVLTDEGGSSQGHSATQTDTAAKSRADVALPTPADGMALPETMEGPYPVPGSVGPVGPAQLVRTVDLEVRVGKGAFERKWSAANNVAARHGGFVTASSSDVQRSGSIGNFTMRVPAAKLEAALADLRRLGTLVRMNRSGYDVSGQLADFDARLRNLRAQEAQLLELLKQAKRVGDVLEIRGRLDGTRQEIEALDGQRAGVKQDVDLSTVQFTLREPSKGSSSNNDESKVERAFEQSGDAFTTTLAGFVLTVGYLGPFALLVLAIWAMLRFRRRGL